MTTMLDLEDVDTSVGWRSPFMLEAPSGMSTPAPDHGQIRNRGRQNGTVQMEPFVRCSQGPQPGAIKMGQQWRRLTGRKSGIYNCRPTEFGTPSHHGEGRAIDLYSRASD